MWNQVLWNNERSLPYMRHLSLALMIEVKSEIKKSKSMATDFSFIVKNSNDYSNSDGL